MSRFLVLSFRFLAPLFHGREDGGAPEWPPSPLRAFQAVVAAAARAGTLEATRSALRWLESLPAPLVIAPEAKTSVVGYRLSVPHNAMDLVAKQWARGDDGNPATHRTMKSVLPHRLPEDAAVHYAWQLDGEESAAAPLIEAARGVVALGWGIDLVVGDGVVLDGERLRELTAPSKLWEPRAGGSHAMRAPTRGTLEDLDRRHQAFLSRTSLADPTLRPPPALSTFAITRYARTDQPQPLDVAAFTLVRPESQHLRAFDTARRGMAVAGMLRHVVRSAAERAGWSAARIRGSVLGHDAGQEPRLLLVPVPSIEPREGGGETVGAVRRVIIYSTEERGTDTAWSRRTLGGMDLVDEKTGEVHAVLALAQPKDGVLTRYLECSRTWTTVTPMVLPGHDDPGGLRRRLHAARRSEEQRPLLERLARRREALVRKTLRHAGLGDELAFSAAIETRETGFIAGVDRASRYAVPSHLRGSLRIHVRLTWPAEVAGPLCLGRGRFSGLGLFASLPA